jgi:hypothetical protein
MRCQPRTRKNFPRLCIQCCPPSSRAAAPAARHPAPFLSVPCGAGLLPPAAGVLARLGVGVRWHGEAGCWEAATGVGAGKGVLYFLYASLPVHILTSSEHPQHREVSSS